MTHFVAYICTFFDLTEQYPIITALYCLPQPPDWCEFSERVQHLLLKVYFKNSWISSYNLHIFRNASENIFKNFRSRRWGSPLPGLRTLDPPLGPPSTWEEIFQPHVPAESPSNISPLRTHIQSFGTLRQLLTFSKKTEKRPIYLFCLDLIGQKKGTLRLLSGLSEVSHPQICATTNVQRLE